MVEVNRDYNFADVTLHASVRILDLFLLRIEYVSHLNLSAAVWNFQSKSVEFYSFLKENNSIELNAKDLILKQNIKNLGEFTADLVLHPEVLGKLLVIVKNIEEKNSQSRCAS